MAVRKVHHRLFGAVLWHLEGGRPSEVRFGLMLLELVCGRCFWRLEAVLCCGCLELCGTTPDLCVVSDFVQGVALPGETGGDLAPTGGLQKAPGLAGERPASSTEMRRSAQLACGLGTATCSRGLAAERGPFGFVEQERANCGLAVFIELVEGSMEIS